MYCFVRIVGAILFCLCVLPGCKKEKENELLNVKVELFNEDTVYKRGRGELNLSSRFVFSLNKQDKEDPITHNRVPFVFDQMLVDSMCVLEGQVSRQLKEIVYNDSVMMRALIPMEALLYKQFPFVKCDFHFTLKDHDGNRKVFTTQNLNINLENESELKSFFKKKSVADKPTSSLIDGHTALRGFEDFRDYTDVFIRCEDVQYTKTLYDPYELTLGEVMKRSKKTSRKKNFVQNCQIAMRQKEAPYNIAFTPKFLFNLGAPRLVVEKFDFVFDYLKEPIDLIKRPVYKAQIYNPSGINLYASVTNYNQHLNLELVSGDKYGDSFGRTEVAQKKIFAEVSDGESLREDLVLRDSENFIFKVPPQEKVFLNIYVDVAKNCRDYLPLHYDPDESRYANKLLKYYKVPFNGTRKYQTFQEHYTAMEENPRLWKGFIDLFDPPNGVIIFSFSGDFIGLNQVDHLKGTQVSYHLHNEPPEGLIRAAKTFNGYFLPHPLAYQNLYVREGDRNEHRTEYPFSTCGNY